MLVVTSLQLLLLLLSAHWQMEAFRYYDFEDIGPYEVGNTNQECDGHAVILKWINEQVTRNAKLTSFNLHLGQLLVAINSTNPNQAGEEHCCFYEKSTMSTIFSGLTNLSAISDMPNGQPIEETGDLGKDLDLILERMKAISAKKAKNCCDRLAEHLKAVEADLMKQLEELGKKLSQQHEAASQQTDELKLNQTNLENKLKNVTDRIDQLEKKQDANQAEAAKCCKELNDRVDKLYEQLEQAKAVAKEKAKQLEKDINELNQKQKDHADKLNNLQKETEKQMEIINKTVEICNNNCGNETTGSGGGGVGGGANGGGNGGNGSGSGSGSTGGASHTSGSFEQQLQGQVHHLENMIVNLTVQIHQVTNVSNAVANCSKIESELTEMLNLLDKLQNQKPPEETVCTSVEELQAALDDALKCCKRVDELSKQVEKMTQQIEQLDKKYSKHVEQLEEALKNVQQQLDDALDQWNQTSTTPSPCAGGNETDSEALHDRIKDLQNQINTLKNILNITEINLNNNEAKLVGISETLKEKSKEFEQVNQDRENAANTFKDQTEEHLNKLELLISMQNSSKPNDELIKRIIKLEELEKIMSEDVEKILKLETTITDLQSQLEEALKRLKDSEANFNECTEKCAKLDELNDLIDRLEDLEQLVYSTTSSTANTPTPATGSGGGSGGGASDLSGSLRVSGK
ncbi:keratin, type II cytoskeletal 1 [Drosophila hydei]|uniref:Keratin, type II cytoskeletal 1 n=1 Tax=Drosophila hydei TaxID=7224 RepID=A0A6J1M9S3_DROHY|nr:keratin, type II cytoskeletal 1 [Drosophila hydei]